MHLYTSSVGSMDFITYALVLLVAMAAVVTNGHDTKNLDLTNLGECSTAFRSRCVCVCVCGYVSGGIRVFVWCSGVCVW